MVCRLGGYEFLVICPHCNLIAAKIVAEKILKDSVPIFTSEGLECWDGSLSIGIVEANIEITEPGKLIDLADKSLYRSKKKGGKSVS